MVVIKCISEDGKTLIEPTAVDVVPGPSSTIVVGEVIVEVLKKPVWHERLAGITGVCWHHVLTCRRLLD